MRLISALIYLSAGAYALYVTKKHWNYVSHLKDSAGNRKIKRLQTMFLTLGVLFVLGAIWNLWLFVRSK
jgi:hypothetical protein